MILSRVFLRIIGIVLVLQVATQSEFNTTSDGTPLENDTPSNWTSVEFNSTDIYTVTHISIATTYASSDSYLEENTSTTPTPSIDSKLDSPKRAKNYLDLIIIPTCFILGSIGNGLTVLTMSTLPFRRMTWSIVLICLAIADTIVLCVIIVRKPFVNDMFGYDILALTNAGCKTFHFMRRSAKMVSSWFVVVICIERFIAICFPLKVKTICTKLKIVVAIVIICLVATIFSGMTTQTVALRGQICMPNIATPDSPSRGRASLITASILAAISPMAILIILTPIVCISLIRQMRARTQMMPTTIITDPYARVSAMLVSIHTSYIVLVLPHFIYTNIKLLHQIQPELYDKRVMDVFKEISGTFEAINHSINFLLYVGFNSMFRKRLKEVFSRSTDLSG